MEPQRAIRIHVCGAVIHSTFTSLTSAYRLRRDDAASLIRSASAPA